jgi:voltage-gated potassium channel
MTFRERVYHVLEGDIAGDRASRSIGLALAVLIVANVIAAVLETVSEFEARFRSELRIFETVSVVIFSIEYLLRVWSIVETPVREAGSRGPLRLRLRFLVSPLSLIDLTVLLPAIVGWLAPISSSSDFRMLRAIRVLRILRMGRFSTQVRRIGHVLTAKREELIIALAIALLLLVLCSTAIYVVERDAQPEAFGSIPAAMWWGVATLTTVGYGDVYPKTPLGKVLGACIALIGVGTFALPAGILASGFGAALAKREREQCCPHCGEKIDGGSK